ncbi:MAG: hypothetical protein E5W41_00235 [Mesorhizobium sp.]|nr:MAG: hypothetical protein E5W41_00235 [Mesorhizobium sp.]
MIFNGIKIQDYDIKIDADWFYARLAAQGYTVEDWAVVLEGISAYMLPMTLKGKWPFDVRSAEKSTEILGATVEEILARAGITVVAYHKYMKH